MESNNIPFVPFNSISLRSEFSLSMLNTNYKLTILTTHDFNVVQISITSPRSRLLLILKERFYVTDKYHINEAIPKEP